jgi:hypothetical protein
MSVRPGSTIYHDPSDELVYTFDWTTDGFLVGNATISTSTFTISGPDSGLTKDNPSILSGSTSTQVRVIGGTLGKTYTLTNRIVTNESPTQTAERSVLIAVRNA